jgi:hypothetical protein
MNRKLYRRASLSELWLSWRRFATRISSAYNHLPQPAASHPAASLALPKPRIRAPTKAPPGLTAQSDLASLQRHFIERPDQAKGEGCRTVAVNAEDLAEDLARAAFAGRDEQSSRAPQDSVFPADVSTAKSGEPVKAGVRAHMRSSADSAAADSRLAIVANVERSGPHKGRLVWRRVQQREGDVIASLSLESLQLNQVGDHVVEMVPVARGQCRSKAPVLYLAFENGAELHQFQHMVGARISK